MVHKSPQNGTVGNDDCSAKKEKKRSSVKVSPTDIENIRKARSLTKAHMVRLDEEMKVTRDLLQTVLRKPACR
jgi:hypothetical protein